VTVSLEEGMKVVFELTRTISSTKPLQLIKDPIAKHSRHNIPVNRAATVAPTNLEKKATAQTPTT